MRLEAERLDEHGLEAELPPAARTWRAQEGYEPTFGARPRQRALQKYVESPLSVKILQGEFEEGDTVIVDYIEEEGVVFRHIQQGTPISIEEEVSA